MEENSPQDEKKAGAQAPAIKFCKGTSQKASFGSQEEGYTQNNPLNCRVSME
jgi:hypothetical protein